MNEVLDTLTKEQAEVLTERWNEMQQSLIKIGTDCLRENKDEHQKNISGGVWELQDGEHDWMDALGSAIKATEEMIE